MKCIDMEMRKHDLESKVDAAVPIREAATALVVEIESVVKEVGEMLVERDFLNPTEFMNNEGRGYGMSTEQWMHSYSDYVLDQSMGNIRWLKNINGLKRALVNLKTALESNEGENN